MLGSGLAACNLRNFWDIVCVWRSTVLREACNCNARSQRHSAGATSDSHSVRLVDLLPSEIPESPAIDGSSKPASASKLIFISAQLGLLRE
jgi:hypothetical protein